MGQTSDVASKPEVRVEIRMPRPWTHLFEVTLTASATGNPHLDFVMPVWTPGSYMVREFSRHVQDFSAAGPNGSPLVWQKTRKNVWRVQTGGDSPVTVSYRVLAFELSVRNSFLDDSRAFLSATSLVCYVDGLLGAPYRLLVHPFERWNRVSTGLDAVPGSEWEFLAPDYDTLADSPIEVGTQRVLEFAVGGAPHRVALTGEGNLDPERLVRDLQKIVEAGAGIMGDMPYPHYTFLINLAQEGRGGLEHRNSCALQVTRWTFRPESEYRQFLSLSAHEYFHLWNVKRLRPVELGPFDYSSENPTRLLWIAEGFTDYYGDRILRLAGLVSADQYLEELSKGISGYMETPGRLVQSAAESSFDAWIKLYRPDAHSPNTSVSYYVKGHLIALVVDLELRRLAPGRSLDDVMRLLYRRSTATGRGITEQDFRDACAEVAGRRIDDLIDACVHSTAELPIERSLSYAGLRFSGEPEKAPGQPKAYLGVSVKTIDGRLTVVAVTAGAPAWEQGINVNDEILAIDGFRVTQEALSARIDERVPGSKIEVLIARAGCVRSLTVELGTRDTREFKIVPVTQADDAQKELYRSWLEAG